MSDAPDSETPPFVLQLGHPAPATPPADFFADKFDKSLWRMMYDEVGSGWYRNRFLYLFGAGLPPVQLFLEAWAAKLAPGVERILIGYNAHGLLLLAENPTEEGTDAPILLLDPARGTVWREEGLDFTSLISDWLPENRIPHFLDQAGYDAYVTQHGFLAPGQVLALPGALHPGEAPDAAYQPEELLSYHQRRA
ncbi:hypothetical protein LJY25_03855 [Hymenobacter sp. BT175]|uniref:hypothetical protein n=1 Tax=Hymenobacter translucens TaxID=2886507 RepID=UPI001D0F1850|nr:hypothetical protein [Hymenobacter translucens]MCC2545567.1 hypothetical protein [Hymenobacter translucens]